MPRPLIPLLALTLLGATACLPASEALPPGAAGPAAAGPASAGSASSAGAVSAGAVSAGAVSVGSVPVGSVPVGMLAAGSVPAGPPAAGSGSAVPAAAGSAMAAGPMFALTHRPMRGPMRGSAVRVVPVRHAGDVPAYGPDAGEIVGRSKRWGRAGREIAERAERLPRRLSRKPGVEPPGISLKERRARGERRPSPAVKVPDVRLYDDTDAVCADTPRSHVHVGQCRVTHRPRRSPAPAVTRQARREPSPTPTPTRAEPTPTPRPRLHAAAQVPPKRPNPLGTVLLMVVLTTVIASATAVAFGAVK